MGRVQLRVVRDAALSLAYSPDGHRLACGTSSGRIHVFDRDLREPAQLLLGHSQRIKSVRYSRDGRFLASTSIDGSARVWQSSGELWSILRVPSGRMVKCAFSPTENTLETSHAIGIRTWFLDTNQLIKAAQARRSRSLTEVERQRFAELLTPR